MINLNFEDEFFWTYKGKIGKRQCYRVFHEDLSLVIKNIQGENIKFPIKDLSSYGVAFYPQKYKDIFVTNKEYKGSVIFKGEMVVQDIGLKVVRISQEVVGCEFVTISRKDEYKLDELILSIQKEQISKIKQKDY